jgi:hypothetical protein
MSKKLLSHVIALKGYCKLAESTHYDLVNYFKESFTEHALSPPTDNRYSANIVCSADGRIYACLQLEKIRLFSTVIAT